MRVCCRYTWRAPARRDRSAAARPFLRPCRGGRGTPGWSLSSVTTAEGNQGAAAYAAQHAASDPSSGKSDPWPAREQHPGNSHAPKIAPGPQKTPPAAPVPGRQPAPAVAGTRPARRRGGEETSRHRRNIAPARGRQGSADVFAGKSAAVSTHLCVVQAGGIQVERLRDRQPRDGALACSKRKEHRKSCSVSVRQCWRISRCSQPPK